MPELDTVKNLAKQTLTIRTLTSEIDNSLWDRGQRLVRNVKHICQLPELGNAGLQIDRFCLITATYFSDAGLACHLETKNSKGKPLTTNTNGDDLLDFCTQMVEEKLTDVIENAKIEKINRIITGSNNHFTRMTEAMILSDARNLDDMGATGIFNEFKQHVIGGKGASDALQIWKRKIDYRYWESRLKRSFRFESVRKLAEQRLSTAEYFMNQLRVETEAHDLKELSVNSTIV